MAFCAGGAILRVFLHASNILLDYREPIPQGFEILYDIAIPAVAGGILGSIGRPHFGLPLAWLLGLFGDRLAARTGSRSSSSRRGRP